ncbi:unnamed protein product [Paramecium sonneborni]|uniref:RING-type E3 ubiquitin transferase n=1 Tax=Paramecium sonneborni TaxID=65129 RepID=A0A8S1R6D7_9CILI|nr:unnamed protein product [Paramecium sonneborni]
MYIEKQEDLILKCSKEIDNLNDELLIQNVINITQEEYMEIQKKNKDNGQKTFCGNPILDLQLFYQCFDCSQDTSHIICKECFVPQNHKNHNVQIQVSSQGFCDCGDTQMFNKKQICPKHYQIDLKFDKELIENNIIFNKYEEFLMTAFRLLLKKMEYVKDYPYDLLENIQVIIQNLKEDSLERYFNSHKIYFMTIIESINETKLIHNLIFKCLEIITNDNIVWSYLTGKVLSQEFKNSFNQNTTSLLEQYIQYNTYLAKSIQLEKDISKFYPFLFQNDEFRTYLQRTVIKNFKNLHLVVHKYQILTQENQEFKLKIYQKINDQRLATLIQKLLTCSQIKKITCRKQIIQGNIVQESYLFMQRSYIEVLRMYKNTQSLECYSLFNVFSDILQEIPLINRNSLLLCRNYNYVIDLMARSQQAIKGIVDQIDEILQQDTSSFKFQILNSSSLEFQKLLNESLLVYSLTRRNPCQQMRNFKLEYKSEKEEKFFKYLLIISITNLAFFRSDFKSMIMAVGDIQSYGVQNILRIILHYYLKNLVPTFNLDYQSPLKLIVFNLVVSDRNFITVLCTYLIKFTNSQEAYNSILTLSGLESLELKLILQNILKRAILNYIIFSQRGNYKFYRGQQSYWKILNNEASLQQVDIAYIQIYAFLFKDVGINDIIQCFNEIVQYLGIQANLTFLICKIAQTDYDLISCTESIIGYDQNEQFLKGLAKLFQTIFYSQTFFQQDEMKRILKELSYQNQNDLETIILSSCEINQDNGQLQLKKELQFYIYEPMYALQNNRIKEKINDQLQMKNDKFAELFGSSLEYELQYYKTTQSTLTNIRFEIINSISQDQNQYLLKTILKDLQNNFQLNNECQQNVDQSIKILQENAIYINLLYLSNLFFKSNNSIIQENLDKILHYCQTLILNQNLNNTQKLFFQVYCQRFQKQKLDQQSNEQVQQSQSKKNHKYKQELKQKFNQMKENFNNKNNLFTKDFDEICLLCKLAFEQKELQYQPILIQYSNIHEHLRFMQTYPTPYTNIMCTHISNCNHIFHIECLQKQMFVSIQSYQKCPCCYSPYNFILPNPYQIKNIEIKQFEYAVETFIESLSPQNQSIVEKNYQKKDFDICLFLDEILSQILCNLIFQLLSDLKTFLEKSQHHFLQKIIYMLRLLNQYQDDKIVDLIKIDEKETLFKILKTVQIHLIKEYNLYQFEQNLLILLNPQFELAKVLFQVFTQKQTTYQINQKQFLLPYDIQKIKETFKSQMLNFLTKQFSSFLDKHCLSPCQKKKCQITKIYLQVEFKGYYICLICFKKMCSEYCGELNKKLQGNLQRHCIKKHQGKSIYLKVENAQLILMHSPAYIFMSNSLFQDRIGDSPIKRPQPLVYYDKFQINMKIVDSIVDIIIEEKYLNRLNTDQKNIQTKEI